MMQKSMITTVIALALLGCGGGESNSGGGTTVVKNYTIDFLGTHVESQADECQIFGYVEKDHDQRDKIIAFPVEPGQNYRVIIHNNDGSVRDIFQATSLSSNRLTFAQNEVPHDGYVSFAEFNANGISHVTTFAKSLLPDSFFAYTSVPKRSSDRCLLDQRGENPILEEVSGYISPYIRGIEHRYSGFNTAYQNLAADLTDHYAKDHSADREIKFVSQKVPLLAITYETTQEGNQLLPPRSFKFTPFDQRGNQGKFIQLNDQTNDVKSYDNDATLTSDLVIENAWLFVNGKQLLTSADYAYLWQPLIQDKTIINDSFSYAERIGDDNYYLYLEGKQDTAHSPYWGVKHVVQGTNNGGTSLSADNILDSMPEANTPTLAECTTDPNRQCLTINTGSLSTDNTVQRVVVDAALIKRPERLSIRQIFYTPVQTTLPILKFNEPVIDAGIEQGDMMVSFLVSESPEIKETFLYQHQNLAEQSVSDLPDLTVDFIPLLKNHAAQQDFQDKLKRHPYTWVWLKTDNH